MPICYQYVSIETNTPTKLPELDDLLCRHIDAIVDKDNYNPLFLLCHLALIEISQKIKKNMVNLADYENYLLINLGNLKLSSSLIKAIDYLLQNHVFWCWRGYS